MKLMRFKSFLFEATSGKAKWEKYFQDDVPEVKIKKDTQLYSVEGERLPTILKAGTMISVPQSNEYSTVTTIIYNNKKYKVKFDDIDKPIQRTLSFNLKPDVLGVTGHINIGNLSKIIISAVNKKEGLSYSLKEYLIGLVNFKTNKISEMDLKSLFNPIKNDLGLIKSINNDFMELLGPYFVKEQMKLSDQSEAFFPSLGNEPLMDFKVDDMSFSSKTSTTSTTNLLKPGDIYNSIKENPKIKTKFPKQAKIIEILSTNSIKTGPLKVAEYIKSFDPSFEYTPTDTNNIPGLYQIEKAVISYMNTNIPFIDLVKLSIPELYYVKSGIDKDGIPHAKPLEKGESLTQVKFRSKNGSTRMADRIGIQI